MKILLVSDTHLGYNKSSDMYHDIVLQLFKNIYKTCLERNICPFLKSKSVFQLFPKKYFLKINLQLYHNIIYNFYRN